MSNEAVEYLNQLNKFGVKPGLERIELLLEYLGNPEEELDIIQIGGSNGKGSTAVMISSILSAGGYKVGTYNSPEIITFYERMRINGEYMQPEALDKLTTEIKPFLARIEEQGLGHPTFFEVVTAIAFKYFAEQEVDFAVMEVGLGGKLDATNVSTNLVSAITNISLEHTEYLGDTIAEIAAEKGGIIDKEGTVVTGVKDQDALAVLHELATAKNAELINVAESLTVKRVSRGLKGQQFKVSGAVDYGEISIPLLGGYQRQNLAVALGILEALPVEVSVEGVRAGLQDVVWPGRLELLGQDPLVILDGAHNPSGAAELAKVIEEDLEYQRLILVLGILADKDVEEMLDILVPLADELILTRNSNHRTSNPKEVAQLIDRDVEVSQNVTTAVKRAVELAGADDLIGISGSLYTIAEARNFLAKNIIK
ncbi:MAG: bifunctional folylpolyglutamate synthase/dihydrofolate synthase [Bacillota bacterium]